MKKLLIGSYILVVILGIVVYANTNGFKGSKDFKAVEAGEKVYKQQCAICHGDTGKGEGAKAGTSLNSQVFLSSVSDKDLYNYTKYGREGTVMPAYGPRLPEKDLKNLVAFMRNWQTEELEFDVPEKIAGDPENGKKVYGLYCLSCHGQEGAGKQKMGTALANPDYLKHNTDKQIWIGTAYGRENTRMAPSLKGLEGVRQLKKNEITDVVTYIRSLEKK